MLAGVMDGDPASPEPAAASSSNVKFIDHQRSTSLLLGMAQLYIRNQFSDVFLMVGEREFPCHRSLLACSSSYFMAMFSSDLAEAKQDKVELKDIDASTLQLILDYIYTGTAQLSEENVQSLLSAANMFQLVPLRNGCADFMTNHVNVSNALGIYFFAKAHQCDDLARTARDVIANKFALLCKETEFMLLPPDKLVEIIGDDMLEVQQEEFVYESCLLWLNFSLQERLPFVAQVMSCVRFANFSPYYLYDHVQSNPLMQNCPEIAELLGRVHYLLMAPSRRSEIDLNYLPRRGMLHARGILVLANPYSQDNNRKFNSMDILFPKQGQLLHINKLPQSLYMPGVCVDGENTIYLAGGAIRRLNYRGPMNTEGVSSNLYVYDLCTLSWQIKPRMKQGRSQFALVLVDGKLLAVGGQNEYDILDSVEMYDPDPAVNSWRLVAPLLQPLRCLTAVSYKSHVYTFGGESTETITKLVYRYDMADDSWLELRSMSIPRAMAGSVVYCNKIYVIGGNSQISNKWKKEFLPEHCVKTVEIFDPKTGEWNAGPDLPGSLCGAGVVRYGGNIVVVGGEDDKSWMTGHFVLETKDDGTEAWVEGCELPSVMSTFGCAVASIPRQLAKDNS